MQAETEAEQYSKFSAIVFEADSGSISTNNEQRDEHLKSKDFMDVKQFPKIIFTATEFDGARQDKLRGILTLKNVTKSIEVSVVLKGVVTDNYGQTKIGFSISGFISRKEFGLTWNTLTETGNVVVSDEIKFEGEMQLVKQKASSKPNFAEPVAELRR